MVLFNKIKLKFIKLVKAELSLHKVALSIAFGFVLGIIPFFLGVNIYLSIFFAWRLKLNHLLVQFVTNVVYPLQLLLFVPFLRLGTEFFSNDKVEFSTQYILLIFKESVWGAIKVLGAWNVYGLLFWVLSSFVLIPFIYFTVKLILQKTNLIREASFS